MPSAPVKITMRMFEITPPDLAFSKKTCQDIATLKRKGFRFACYGQCRP